MAVKAIIQAVLMKICLKIRNVLMLFAVKAKTLTAVGNVKMWQTVKQAFFNSGENDAKAYALYIKKYGTEKYTERIFAIINKGYDYPRSFKDINDIDKILGIFEMEKY